MTLADVLERVENIAVEANLGHDRIVVEMLNELEQDLIDTVYQEVVVMG